MTELLDPTEQNQADVTTAVLAALDKMNTSVSGPLVEPLVIQDQPKTLGQTAC